MNSASEPSPESVDLREQSEANADCVRAQWGTAPRVGLILGSGQGGLARQLEQARVIDYADLPYFAKTTAIGHQGRLFCGNLAGVPLIAFQGRFHLYEGHTAQQASMPVRLLQSLGAEALIVCNAAGGLDPQYRVGDSMLIEDQINLQFANPLIGVNDDALGVRFPDMSAVFDDQLQRAALTAAQELRISLRRGVYVSVMGPNYETRAEYRMLRRLGADAVGMSTTPETIAARHAGMRVLGFSTITNVGSPDILHETDGHDVINQAEAASEDLGEIIRAVLRECFAVSSNASQVDSSQAASPRTATS